MSPATPQRAILIPPACVTAPRRAFFCFGVLVAPELLFVGCDDRGDDRGGRGPKIESAEPASAPHPPPSDDDAPAPTLRDNTATRDSPDNFSPAGGGWESEAVAEAVQKKLDVLAKFLAGGGGDTGSEFGLEVALELPSTARLEEVFSGEGVSVFRAEPPRGAAPQSADAPVWPDLLRKTLAPGTVGSHGETGASSRTAATFKLTGIEVSDTEIATTALYECTTGSLGRATQVNATCEIVWTRGTGGGPDAITSLAARDLELARLGAGAWFHDATAAVLSREPALSDALSKGTDYWQGQIERRLHIYRFGHHGVSVGDIDDDGRDDLYLPQPGGLPNRLLWNGEDGVLADRTERSGVGLLDLTRSSLILDLDNDGDEDLAVKTVAKLLFYTNDGTGKFNLVGLSDAGRSGYSMAAADYDLDGDLDLFVCSYSPNVKELGRLPFPVPYHDAKNGGRNVLLRNDGEFKFTDVTARCGLDADNSRFSFAAAWEDYDSDGDPDLYVANDYGRNNLFRNGGVGEDGEVGFTDVAAAVGAEDIASGMSVSWGDYNRDGHPDVYVGNMFSAAGNRIAYQRQFQPGAGGEARADLQRLARGNSLFENVAGGARFDDVSAGAHVTMGRWAWSSLFADVNNDGWEDILVANGYITGTKDDDL